MLNTNTFQELERLLPPVLNAGNVPFIQGYPGVGKSSFAKKLADKANLFLVDVRLSTLDPVMLNGFLWCKDSDEKASFRALDRFPLAGDPIPINPKTSAPYRGFLLLLDEFTQMPKAVEGGTFQLVLDKVVCSQHLHPKCAIMCAGNPTGKGMIAKDISTPMRTRLVHYELQNTLESFLTPMIDLGFHPIIIGYLQTDAGMLNNFVKNATNKDGTYACERSWEMMSNNLKEMEKLGKLTKADLPTFVGTIGDAAGNGLFAFYEHYYSCPEISKIVGDPINTPLPPSKQEQYAALVFLVDKTTETNSDNLATYIKRFDEEMQLIFGRVLLSKNVKAFDKSFEFITDLIAKYAL